MPRRKYSHIPGLSGGPDEKLDGKIGFTAIPLYLVFDPKCNFLLNLWFVQAFQKWVNVSEGFYKEMFHFEVSKKRFEKLGNFSLVLFCFFTFGLKTNLSETPTHVRFGLENITNF